LSNQWSNKISQIDFVICKIRVKGGNFFFTQNKFRSVSNAILCFFIQSFEGMSTTRGEFCVSSGFFEKERNFMLNQLNLSYLNVKLNVLPLSATCICWFLMRPHEYRVLIANFVTCCFIAFYWFLMLMSEFSKKNNNKQLLQDTLRISNNFYLFYLAFKNNFYWLGVCNEIVKK
jgi:hypothetical protein